jgi:uncharacterized repeat protein (TIGR01451 family)
VNNGSFSIPGSLATNITTFLSDGVTPTSAAGAGPGEALVYKITVTNTGSPPVDNTGVVLTDQLPKEIFDIVGAPTTDRGTCGKTGSWPSTTVTCQLGSLAYGETATVSFTASIIVRDPSGLPQPPANFANKVFVRSDQQTSETSASVETVINIKGISCQDYNQFVDTVESFVGLAPGIGTLAGFVWRIAGKPLQGSCTPQSYPAALVEAKLLASEELLGNVLDLIAADAGLDELPVDAIPAIIEAWIYYHDTH